MKNKQDNKPAVDFDKEKLNMTEKQDIVTWVNTELQKYSDARFKFERNWYVADNFWDGNHFVWWRKSTGTIDRVKPPKGVTLRQVPKLKKQFEAMANLIVANNPKWIAYPDETGDVQEEQQLNFATRRRMWLEDIWDEQNMKGKCIEAVLGALKFPYSAFEVSTDPETRKQIIDVWEPFELYWKPSVKCIDDSPMVVKTVSKLPEEILNNPIYTLESDVEFNLEKRFAYSDLKEMREAEKFGAHNTTEDRGGILKEVYFWDYKDDKKIMRLISIYADKVVRSEILPLKRYPFAPLKLQAGPYFQQSYLESLIPTNKSIDLIVSNIETFFHTMTRGKWLKHKNSTISRVTNENGDFIEYDVEPPVQVPLASIPNYVFVHMANLEKWIEERTVSSSTTGRAPRGIRAYKAIESLKQSDFANMGGPVTFLEECLERVAELINEQADIYLNSPTTVKRVDEEKPDYFQVVGASNYSGEDGVVPISASTKIDVQIESGLSYTEEGKRQTMLELFELGLIPPDMLLKVFRFSNVGEILAKAQAGQQVSMIDTQDFQALPDELKKVVLQTLQQLNINIPVTPEGETRVKRNTGSKSKSSQS